MNAHLIQNWVYKYRIGALSSFKNSCLYNFVQMRYQIIFLKISAANAYKTVTNLLSFDFKPFFLALFCVIGAIPAPGIFFFDIWCNVYQEMASKRVYKEMEKVLFLWVLMVFCCCCSLCLWLPVGWDRTFSKTHHYPCGQLPGYWSVGDPVVHAF